MGVLYQVLGPATVYVTGSRIGLGGVSYLGICRESININITQYDEPIRSDNAGPRMQADLQYMGKDATIDCVISQVDPAILATISALGQNDEGDLAALGTPMFAGGLTFGLRIPAPVGGAGFGWEFPCCVMRSHRETSGTVYTTYSLNFYAYVPIGNTIDVEGLSLYTEL